MKSTVLLATVLIGAAAMSWLPVPVWLSSMADRFTGVLSPPPVGAESPAYRTAPVERGDIVTTVQAAGTLNALVVVEVGSQISGLVTELYVDFNSTVTEGELIARVDPDMYEAKVAQAEAELEMANTLVAVQTAQIERAEAELESAEARLASAKAELVYAEVALTGAAQELERKRPLAEKRVITAGHWERVENKRDAAAAHVAAARWAELSQVAAVRAARAGLGTAKAQLANSRAQEKQRRALLRQAQIALDRTYIRAPVTGTVVNRAVSGGQTLAASLQSPVLFTIAQDLTKMQVEASIVEADVSRFVVGQPVLFTVDAYPERRFRGSVRQIRKAPKIVQNVVTYVVVIDAENADEVLLPGMTANLKVVVARREGALTVPNVALRFRPRGTGVESATVAQVGDDQDQGLRGRVFVLGPGGQPVLVPLRLGITDGRRTEVLAGDLAEGDPVITGFAASAAADAEDSSFLVRFRLQ